MKKLTDFINEGSDELMHQNVNEERISWAKAAKMKSKFNMNGGNDGISTEVSVQSDGFTLKQVQGGSNVNSVFLTFDQLSELVKQLK